MSCYDWPQLLAHRFDPEAAVPTDGWREALRHLDECDDCRVAALDIDPLLAFDGAAAWDPDAEEIDSIRSAVHLVRRSNRLAREGDAPRGPVVGKSRRIAAASLFVGTLLLLPATLSREEAPEPWPTRRATGSSAPAIEGLDRPFARVYEWGGDDLSVVMVVDESLDV